MHDPLACQRLTTIMPMRSLLKEQPELTGQQVLDWLDETNKRQFEERLATQQLCAGCGYSIVDLGDADHTPVHIFGDGALICEGCMGAEVYRADNDGRPADWTIKNQKAIWP